MSSSKPLTANATGPNTQPTNRESSHDINAEVRAARAALERAEGVPSQRRAASRALPAAHKRNCVWPGWVLEKPTLYLKGTRK